MIINKCRDYLYYHIHCVQELETNDSVVVWHLSNLLKRKRKTLNLNKYQRKTILQPCTPLHITTVAKFNNLSSAKYVFFSSSSASESPVPVINLFGNCAFISQGLTGMFLTFASTSDTDLFHFKARIQLFTSFFTTSDTLLLFVFF